MLLEEARFRQLIQSIPVRQTDETGNNQGHHAENQEAYQTGQQKRGGNQQTAAMLFPFFLLSCHGIRVHFTPPGGKNRAAA